MRIGIFDSGIGGINVLSCLRKKYPNNDYIYFGDTKNIPYGDKSKKELLKLAKDAIDFLLTKNVDIIIIACGTISSNCYEILKKEYNIPIYDIISPTIKYLENCNLDKIGVIGTRKTIESGIFNLSNNILTKATPNLVPIIENNTINENKDIIISELECFRNYDLLVLGCTHYPILKELIENSLNTKTLDMGEVISNAINLTNDGIHKCELYFSLVNATLINSVNSILGDNYQIFVK
jgi:glutamate racemase